MEILTRDNRATNNAVFNTLSVKQQSRNLFCCNLGSIHLTNTGTESAVPILGANDPYRNATQLEGAVKVTDDGNTSAPGGAAFIDGLSWNSTTQSNLYIWSSRVQGDPASLGWSQSACGGTNSQPSQNIVLKAIQHFPYGLDIPTGPQNNSYSMSFYSNDNNSATNQLVGQIRGQFNGLQFNCGDVASGGTLSDCLDLLGSGATFHFALTAPSLALNGGAQATGTVGNGGKLQETTTATKTSGNPFAFDAAGNTVNATAANIVGVFSNCSGTQYLGADGACHTSGAGTSTSVVSLFTGCSGTQYLGADGACHSAASSLTPATTSTLGGVKCDGTTITCAGDGTITSTTGGGPIQANSGTANGSASVNFISYTTPSGASHFYRVCYSVAVLTVAMAGTFNVYETYYAGSGHQVGGFAVGTTSATSWTYKNGCWQFQADASTNISFSLNFSGITGSPVFNYAGTLELLK
jgi:hypothetical protein